MEIRRLLSGREVTRRCRSRPMSPLKSTKSAIIFWNARWSWRLSRRVPPPVAPCKARGKRGALINNQRHRTLAGLGLVQLGIKIRSCGRGSCSSDQDQRVRINSRQRASHLHYLLPILIVASSFAGGKKIKFSGLFLFDESAPFGEVRQGSWRSSAGAEGQAPAAAAVYVDGECCGQGAL